MVKCRSLAALGMTLFKDFLRKTKDIQHPSLSRPRRQVAHGIPESQRDARVAHVQAAHHDGTRPSTYAGQHCDVLLAVRAAIGGGLADDPRAGLELPQRLATPRVHRLEPAVHGAV